MPAVYDPCLYDDNRINRRKLHCIGDKVDEQLTQLDVITLHNGQLLSLNYRITLSNAQPATSPKRN